MGSDAEQVANAFAEVQRRSLEAAAAVVDRLVALVDGRDAVTPPAEGEPADPMDGIAKLWQGSVAELARIVPGLTPQPGIEIGGSGAASPIAIPVDGTGEGSAEVWLHNHTDQVWSSVRMRAAAPMAHDGAELPPLRFDPEAFDLPARSSRGVVVSATAPGAAAGWYRTVVLVEGAPEQWLPVVVVVA